MQFSRPLRTVLAGSPRTRLKQTTCSTLPLLISRNLSPPGVPLLVAVQVFQ